MIPFNNVINYKRCHLRANYMPNGGTSGGEMLNVDTELLSDYGTYLESLKKTLDDLLNSLDSQMASITDGWSDKDGTAFKEKFSAFIKESKKISTEINSLGNYAKIEASKYDTILSESIKMMGED